MILLPAIDIRGGRCVRLIKGDFQTAHQVANSAEEAALSFLAAGAEMLHVVDLDGALNGARANEKTVAQILKTGAKIELGGGIRDMETVEFYLSLGAKRVILGSAALKDPAFVKEAVKRYKEGIAVGIDAKDGYVSVDGWTCKSKTLYTDFAKEMESVGVQNIIYTDIETDGTLTGPNFAHLRKLQETVSCDITASGGVKDIGHVKTLLSMGLYGAIAGKAVYSGTLDLKEAIGLCKGKGE